MLNLEVVLIIHYDVYRDNLFTKKKKMEIKINDWEVIRALELYAFFNIFPKEVKLNNGKSSSKFTFRTANYKYFKDNETFFSGS